MPEIYADWKSLEPLTAPVPVGTKCVVIGNSNNHRFACGQIVYRSDYDEPLKKAYKYSDGDDYWWLLLVDVALLPADYQAAPKAEQTAPARQTRRIVQICSSVNAVLALCDNSELWSYSLVVGDWQRIPPIQQD